MWINCIHRFITTTYITDVLTIEASLPYETTNVQKFVPTELIINVVIGLSRNGNNNYLIFIFIFVFIYNGQGYNN
jgi:hypothetical protein